MGMLDCPRCWDLYCECGYLWKDMDKSRRINLASAILGISKDVLKEKLGDVIPNEHVMKNDKL